MEWEQTFGYQLPRGFGRVTERQEDLLERCLQSKDDTAYQQWRERKMKPVRRGRRIY